MLHRIIIFVHNPPAQAAFYQKTFGFKPIPSEDDPQTWIELDTGAARLAFHKAHGSTGPTGDKDNPHKLVFFTQDVPALREKLIAQGLKMGKLQTHNTLTFCDAQDPEGHPFQISNRP